MLNAASVLRLTRCLLISWLDFSIVFNKMIYDRIKSWSGISSDTKPRRSSPNTEIELKFVFNWIFIFDSIFRLERSKVRVTFYQSGKPQLISPPEPQFFDFFDGPVQLNSDTAFHPNETNFSVDGMATLQSTIPVNYDRQIRYVVLSKYIWKLSRNSWTTFQPKLDTWFSKLWV